MAPSSSGGRLAGSQPPVPAVQRSSRGGVVAPDRLFISVPTLTAGQTRRLAAQAAQRAQALAPKLSGRGARGIQAYSGEGFFGVRFADPYMGIQESGARPFTMRRLAGKTIPMWIDDPTGRMHAKNPKAKTRITQSGRRQVLIFRKAAAIGARKTVRRGTVDVSVPASYPGAPGRIAYREVTEYGGVGGRIAKTMPRSTPGVRWRHPGLMARHFMHQALISVANDAGLRNVDVQATFRRR